MLKSALNNYRKISLLCALIILMVGLIVLFGWIRHLPILVSIHPNWVRMKVNTALGFVFAGIAILCLLAEKSNFTNNSLCNFAAKLCASVVFTIGALTLIEYIFGIDLYIDQLLIKQDASPLDYSAHGRMSPFTSIMQMCSGTALLLLGGKRNDTSTTVAQSAAFICAALGILTFFGYLLDARSLYAVGHTTAIAAHTAACFILLGLSLLFLEPNSALMRTFTSNTQTGQILRKFIPMALLVPALIGWARVAGQNIGLYDFQTGLALVVTAWVITWEMGIFWISKKFQDVEIILSKREEQLSAQAELLDLTHDAIISSAIDGKILFWNRGAERMYGYSSAQAVGQIIHALLKTEFPSNKDHILSSALAVGKWEGELVHCTKADETVVVASRWSIKRDEHGEPVAILEINNDISATKEAERRVSEFYSTVSHELRTPLTSMKGAFSLLSAGRVGDLSDRAKQLVSIGLVETERLIRLINNILDIRKIESGKFELLLEPIEPKELIEQTVNSTSSFALQYSVKLRQEINANEIIMADKDRLIQILTNLISNAVKFSDPGESVDITTSRSGKCVRFSVKDTGPGIDPRNVPKLFRMFQQIDSPEQPKGGTGLGLAVCKSLVEQHGGTIGIDTDLGKGTTFWFEIPAHEMSK